MGPQKVSVSYQIPSLKISVNKRGEQSETAERKNKLQECMCNHFNFITTLPECIVKQAH